MVQIRYVTWKYWPAPMLHGVAMAITAAYDMYTEYCGGDLEADWKVAKKDRMEKANFGCLHQSKC